MMLAASDQVDENDLVRRIQEAAKTKALDLSGLRLTATLPPQVASIKYLRSINLYKNFLDSIPDEVLRFEMLEDLNLYRNRFSRVPRSLPKLTNLRVLNIGSNALESIAPVLFELKTLEELDLSNNQIKSIPTAIASLSHLRDLKMSRNRIKSLPGEIGDLKLLRKLDLSFNQIVNLPSNFGKLSALAVFNVSDNPLRSPPMAVVKRGRQAIVQFLQQDSTDATKSRADGAGLKGSIVGLTANFTIFSCNTQGRERLAGGDNFVVRITREGVAPSAADPPEPEPGAAAQPESSDTDGTTNASTSHPSPKSDTDDDQPPASAAGQVEEIPNAPVKPLVETKPKRSGRSKRVANRGDKAKKSKRRQPQSEPAPATHRSNTSEEASGEDDVESIEESDEKIRNKVTLAVQEDKNDFFAAITDNYNGTYGVNYTPMFEGSYIMSVTLLGVHIHGSPFTISIDPDLRDKTKTLELQLEDEQRKLAEENERAIKEKIARSQMEEELKRLHSEVDSLKTQLDSVVQSLEEKNLELARLEKENADLKDQISQQSHKKKAPHKKEQSVSGEVAVAADSDVALAAAPSLIRSRSGKSSKKHKHQNSDDGADSSASTTPRPESTPAPNLQDAAAKKKARLSTGANLPVVTIAEDVSSTTKSPRNVETKQRRRSKGPADAAAIQAALQQQDDASVPEKQSDKKMNRSNSAPLNARVEKSNLTNQLAQSSSSNDAREHDSDTAALSPGQGEIESRSISYKFSLAFWKLFDKKEPKESKEAKTKDSSAPKSARASSTKPKGEDGEAAEDETVKEKKSKHKAK